MLIIVEGPDGSGKSTLVRQLTTRLGERPHELTTVLRKGPPTEHALDEYETPLLTYRPGLGRHIICDRWHWGERVYPRVLERETTMDEPVWHHIEATLRSRGALVVRCDRLLADLLETYRVRTDPAWQSEHALTVNHAFRMMATISQLPTLEYRPGYHTGIEHLIELAEALERMKTVLNPFTTYVGPVDPPYLLLGDVRNGHELGDTTDLRPAFVPRRATSGHYLLRALWAAGGSPRVIGIGNACDEDDVEKLWETLGRPATVALGTNADRRLITLKIPHGAAPHPQYVRRFHHSEFKLYGDVIMTAAHDEGDHRKWR